MSEVTNDLSLEETEAFVTDEVTGGVIEEAEPLASLQLPFSFAKRFKVLIESAHEPVKVYHTPNTELAVFAEVRRFLNRTFVLEEIADNRFEELLTSSFQRDSSAAKQLMEDLGNESDVLSLAEDLPDTEDLLESEGDAPIIRLINAMLGEAIKEGASDIHIETFENQLVVRFRVDGVLREILRPHRKMSSMLVSRIKVMSKMDIAEKRVPQDGRISLRIAGRAVDVRVSTMPSSHGERVVLRLLDKNNARLDLQDLGMTLDNRTHFSSLIRKPHGIMLVTGPTGSGK
ncbi:MAG: ATPase, T2SS/T4P/T4SS family, partial [Glaciecola sp.]